VDREETLSKSFKRIGKEYGYDSVEAEFAAFKEFKVRWQRSYRWAEFKVSDYLMDAPAEVVDDLAATLFSKITCSGRKNGSTAMRDWVTNPAFAKYKQPVYLRRSRNLKRTHVGENHDLRESHARLVGAGLLTDDPQLHLSWAKESLSKKSAFCSVLMKVVGISPVFDDADVPEFVVDYLVYTQCVRVAAAKETFGDYDGHDFRPLEKRYPRWEEAEGWLDRLCMYR